MPPDIETSRLVGHRPTLADLPDCADMWADPETRRFLGVPPSTPEESYARILRNIGHWHVHGYGFWVMRARATGRLVGDVGLRQFRRDLDPALNLLPEAGWVLAPHAWGQGFATEAATAALAWADTHIEAPEILCMINPDNTASLRVAAKLGFTGIAAAKYHDADVRLFSRRAARRASAPSP